MKTAVSLPEPLIKVVDRVARNLGLSSEDLIHLAVEKFVQRYEPVTESLNRTYASVETGVDPVMLEMALRSLPKEDW